jgi:Ca2+-binding RTX toxin-like protein
VQVGATTIAADTKTDTLTLIAGANVTLTPDAANDTITIAATGTASNAFGIVAVSGQSNVEADASNDTLTLVAGANMTLTTNPGADSVTFAVSGLAAVATSGSYADLSGTPAQFFIVKTATGTPYTLVSGDAGRYLRLSHTSKITLDIPLATFALGDEVLIEQSGAGKIEIVPASGVTLLNTSQYLSVTFGQYAIIGIKCVSNNTYVVTGEREPV